MGIYIISISATAFPDTGGTAQLVKWAALSLQVVSIREHARLSRNLNPSRYSLSPGNAFYYSYEMQILFHNTLLKNQKYQCWSAMHFLVKASTVHGG